VVKDSPNSTSYLDLYLEHDINGTLTTKYYDKRDYCIFPIVNYPFLDSNIPSSPAYGVYMSQLIRYLRTCNSYRDFLHRSALLTRKLLSQGFIETTLRSTLKMFHCLIRHRGHHDGCRMRSFDCSFFFFFFFDCLVSIFFT